MFDRFQVPHVMTITSFFVLTALAQRYGAKSPSSTAPARSLRSPSKARRWTCRSRTASH